MKYFLYVHFQFLHLAADSQLVHSLCRGHISHPLPIAYNSLERVDFFILFFWDLRFSNPILFSEALSILKLQHHEDAKQNYIYIHIFHRLILSEETFNRQIFKWRKHNYITFSCGLSSIIHMYSQCYSTGFFTEELVKASLDNIQIYSLC